MDPCRVLKLLRLLFTKGFQNILSPEGHSQETVKRMSFGTYLRCRSSVCLFRKGTACIYDWHKFEKRLSTLTELKFRTIQIHSREIKIYFVNSKTHRSCPTTFHLTPLGPTLGAASMGSFPVWHEGSLGRRSGTSGCGYSSRSLSNVVLSGCVPPQKVSDHLKKGFIIDCYSGQVPSLFLLV